MAVDPIARPAAVPGWKDLAGDVLVALERPGTSHLVDFEGQPSRVVDRWASLLLGIDGWEPVRF